MSKIFHVEQPAQDSLNNGAPVRNIDIAVVDFYQAAKSRQVTDTGLGRFLGGLFRISRPYVARSRGSSG